MYQFHPYPFTIFIYSEVYSDYDYVGTPQTASEDFMAKVQLLEDELAEALEANNRYKLQLQRYIAKQNYK